MSDAAAYLPAVSADGLLVNHFYAHPVGPVIEALQSAIWSIDGVHTVFV